MVPKCAVMFNPPTIVVLPRMFTPVAVKLETDIVETVTPVFVLMVTPGNALSMLLETDKE